MDDKTKESISALMDDEANELEIQRLLSKTDSQELLETWKRYHKGRDLMEGMPQRLTNIDISSQVAAAIRGEEVQERIAKGTQANGPLDEEPVKAATSSRFRVFSGAIAACLVVVVGLTLTGQNANNVDEPGSQLASVSELPNSQENVEVAVAAQPETLELVMNELDETQVKSFNRYLLRHSELSTLNIASVMAPLVRVASVNSVGI